MHEAKSRLSYFRLRVLIKSRDRANQIGSGVGVRHEWHLVFAKSNVKTDVARARRTHTFSWNQGRRGDTGQDDLHRAQFNQPIAGRKLKGSSQASGREPRPPNSVRTLLDKQRRRRIPTSPQTSMSNLKANECAAVEDGATVESSGHSSAGGEG